MGAAAYNRGSAAIGRQFAAEAQTSRLVSIDRYDLQAIEAESVRLKAENARLSVENERARRSVRMLRATLTVERADRAEQTERSERIYRDVVRAMFAYRRRWEWVSRLLRRVASPAQVAAEWAEMDAEQADRREEP